MTIVRLKNDDLVLHSPTRPDDSLVSGLKALGKVKFIVGPCVMHTTYLLNWKTLFPEAEILVAPRTGKRIPSLKGIKELSDQNPIAPDELKQKLMHGHTSRETLFLHIPSKTLIATDLIYNIGKTSDLLEQWYYRLYRAFGKPAVCNYHRKYFRDTHAAWAVFQEIFNWDFDRVIMSHGEIIEKNGKSEFIRVWSEFFKNYYGIEA